MAMLKLPGSPYKDTQIKQVNELARELLDTFRVYYLQSLKQALFDSAREKRYAQAQKVLLDQKRVGQQRPVLKSSAPPARVWAKIAYSVQVNNDTDPYYMYAVTTEFGGERVTVFKRYKHFKRFHAKHAAIAKAAGAKLPEPSSKFGGRNLSLDFVRMREKQLQDYLDAVFSTEKAVTNSAILAFLGVGQQKEPVYQRAFENSLRLTRQYYNQWKRLVYDDEPSALSELIIQQVRDTMWKELSSKASSLLRKRTMKQVAQAVARQVEPMSRETWRSLQEQAATVRNDAAYHLMQPRIAAVVEARDKLKADVLAALQGSLTPTLDALRALIGPLAVALTPKVMEVVLSSLTAEKAAELSKKFDTILSSDDYAGRLKEFREDLAEVRQHLMDRCDAPFQRATNIIVGDFRTKASLAALEGFFTPLAQFSFIAKNVFQYLDPVKTIGVVEELFKVKADFKQSAAKANEVVSKWQETIRFDAIPKARSALLTSGWRCSWNLYHMMPEAYLACTVFDDFVSEGAELVKRAFEKFVRKASEHLLAEAKTAANNAVFRAAVDQAYVTGYEKAWKHFIKHLLHIVVQSFKKFISLTVADKVEKSALQSPAARAALRALHDRLQAPLDYVLDVDAVGREVVLEAVDAVLDESVASIHPALAKAVAELKARQPSGEQIWAVKIIDSQPLPSAPAQPAIRPRTATASAGAAAAAAPAGAAPAGVASSSNASSNNSSAAAAGTPSKDVGAASAESAAISAESSETPAGAAPAEAAASDEKKPVETAVAPTPAASMTEAAKPEAEGPVGGSDNNNAAATAAAERKASSAGAAGAE